jgi:F-type H+-transporting ATPase subunit b
MLIDWFTVGAQILNFLVLVGLMKHFLYKPILNAIDEREKLVAKELGDAAAQKAEAQKAMAAIQKEKLDFDQKRDERLKQVAQDAKAEGQRLLVEAQKKSAELRDKQRFDLRSEEQNLHQSISGRIQQEVFAIVRKAFSDLAGTSLEERMVDVFSRNMKESIDEKKGILASLLNASKSPVIVRTAFELSASQRTSIEEMLKKSRAADIMVKFETSPDLISGIELVSNGNKVAWSIADYVKSLENGVDEILKEKKAPEVHLEPKNGKPKELPEDHEHEHGT